MRPPPPFVSFLLLLVGLLITFSLTSSQSESTRPSTALTPSDGPLASAPLISNHLPVSESLRRPSPSRPLPSVGRGPAVRSLLSSDADESGRSLLASLDGTLYSVDSRSQVIQWKFSTGSPLWHFESSLSNNDDNDYFIYPGENWNLYEYSKDVGARKLNLTVEELVHNTPQIKGSVVTVGSKTTTVYYVDADSGEILSQDHLPGNWPAVVPSGVEEKSLSSNLETGKIVDFILTIIRTNYFLNSSDLGKPLWSFSTSHFTARITHMSSNKLGLSPSFQFDLPVFFLSESGNLGRAMLPPASHVQNSTTREQASLNAPLLLQNSCEIEKGYSMGIIAASQQNTADASLSFKCQLETDQILSMQDDNCMPLNTSQNSLKAENICHVRTFDAVKPNVDGLFGKFTIPDSMMLPYYNQASFTTMQNPSKGATAVRKCFSVMFSEAIIGILSCCTISSLLILPALCYLKRRKPINHDKQLNDMGGRLPIVPKKKKARKAGNIKNGAAINNHDRLISSEKDHAETNCNTHMQSNESYPFINLIQSDDAVDGRWVGRLYVSNSEIGRGSNGTVVLEGVYDGRPVAVKRLLRAHHDVAFKEIRNLIASDRHSNIVRWYGVEQDIDFVYISLERCTCSLSDLVQLCSDSSSLPTFTESQTSNSMSNQTVRLECVKTIDKDLELWRQNGFPSSQLLKLMRDVVSGLAHLHELGIIHRDLKPQNVLISNEGFLNAKLSDMGISKRLLEDMSSLSHHTTGYGSSGWQAPEQLLHGRQTRAVDLFSLGCILFFCMTKGKHPFGSYFERDSNILNNRIDLFLVDHIPEAVDLLSQLLDADPKMRPTAVEVLHSPFFWSSEARLSFLRDTSDRVELEDRENESELLKALENIAPVAFCGKWDEKLDAAFITDMGRYRKYNFDCTRDLLRVIRNKLNHYRELPKELQEILGPIPEGFDRYFASRFPKLLTEVHKVIARHCREEDCFRKYFKSSLV